VLLIQSAHFLLARWLIVASPRAAARGDQLSLQAPRSTHPPPHMRSTSFKLACSVIIVLVASASAGTSCADVGTNGALTWSGAATITTYAFLGCTSLTSVTIPDSVTSIEHSAFWGCSSLTSAAIGNSVTSIGDYAFLGCSSLTSAAIPDSVTSIGNNAFYQCSSLTSAAIPDSVTSIGDYTFYACSSLTSAAIGNSVTSIGDSAFHSCSSLTSAAIGNSVTSIGNNAFSFTPMDSSSPSACFFFQAGLSANEIAGWDSSWLVCASPNLPPIPAPTAPAPTLSPTPAPTPAPLPCCSSRRTLLFGMGSIDMCNLTC